MHITNLIQDLMDDIFYLLILVYAGYELWNDIQPYRDINLFHAISHTFKNL